MSPNSTLGTWVEQPMELSGVNAYALVDNITIPLLFKIFKPRHRLQEGDVYKTKPQLAEEIIRELLAFGFKFHLVLALLFVW